LLVVYARNIKAVNRHVFREIDANTDELTRQLKEAGVGG
jgi:hypothetical protein